MNCKSLHIYQFGQWIICLIFSHEIQEKNKHVIINMNISQSPVCCKMCLSASTVMEKYSTLTIHSKLIAQSQNNSFRTNF